MKPVKNKSLSWKPQVGQLMQLISSSVSDTHLRRIVAISPCEKDFGPLCKQDAWCTYCLKLIFDPDSNDLQGLYDNAVGNHCFKDVNGLVYWKLAGREE
jgi:hypothetical protein